MGGGLYKVDIGAYSRWHRAYALKWEKQCQNWARKENKG